MSHTFDFVGIGLGPFNLSLAAMSEPVEYIDALFLEQKSEFNWHPGMMLDGVSLQTPFMSDLVTLADPTNRYSFLNYAKLHNKLYPFYIRESFFLLRREYNQYCQWVSSQLSNVRFNHCVKHVTYDEQHDRYELHVIGPEQDQLIYARKLVLGTGPAPYVPECCEHLCNSGHAHSKRVFHAGSYMQRRNDLLQASSVTVVGGGQSAAEIVYDLLSQLNPANYDSMPQINWITRSPRYFPLEYTKLTLEMTSPEYVDYFYNLPAAKRDALNSQHSNLYKGINSELINDIYDLLYQKNLEGPVNVCLKTHSALEHISKKGDTYELRFFHQELNQHYVLDSDFVVLATGFQPSLPPFLEGIKEHIAFDKKGRFNVSRDYATDKSHSRIYVQNAEQHTHGFVTPDLGMACYRNSCILNAIYQKEVYPVESRIAFQTFSLDDVSRVSEVPA